jgi:hypothetical protein
MIEIFVLGVLEKVLSQYIGDVLTKRRSERTRAEVIAAVRMELSRVGDVQEQVDALTLAVRELDFVVSGDKYLRWEQDTLTVEPPRRVISRKPLDAEAAIAELHASVARRRRELEQTPGREEQDDAIRVVEVDQGRAVPDPGSPQKLTPWQEKVVGLQSDIRKERRRAKDK